MTYNRICCMIPTYGRSNTLFPVCLKTAIETSSSPSSVCFALCINVRDVETQEFLAAYDWRGHDWETFEENLPSPNLATYFNMLFDKTKTKPERGTLVTMLGDDMEFLTPNWDKLILDAVNAYKGVGVFWANDDYIARERCPVNLFLARDFVDATEHPFMCESFDAEMIDYIWGKVGKYTKTSHFLPDVHIKHNHNTRKQRSEWDDTFKRLNVIQERVHKGGGKARAKEIAVKIADVLKAKGFTGDSVC